MREAVDKPIFNKTCECGNWMSVRVAKITENGKDRVEVYTVPGSDGKPSCYLVGNSTTECAKCQKRYRTYHGAHAVEARLWK